MKFPYKMIDLTYALSKDTPHWSGGCGFSHEVIHDYKDCDTEAKFRIQEIKMSAGVGTHLDAPAHCVPGAMTVDELSLDDLVAPCVVIDISDQAQADDDFIASSDVLVAFEKAHGKIAANSFVIFHSGWGRHWQQPQRYINDYRFPSIDASCADYLLERDIVGIGIDTLSPDKPSDEFPVHQRILGAGKYIVENVANSQRLPPQGSYSVVLPMKVVDGTEAAVRMVGLING